jgi:hypothetical protein
MFHPVHNCLQRCLKNESHIVELVGDYMWLRDHRERRTACHTTLMMVAVLHARLLHPLLDIVVNYLQVECEHCLLLTCSEHLEFNPTSQSWKCSGWCVRNRRYKTVNSWPHELINWQKMKVEIVHQTTFDRVQRMTKLIQAVVAQFFSSLVSVDLILLVITYLEGGNSDGIDPVWLESGAQVALL